MDKRYDNLDGLRVISCFCIIAMHIRANAEYRISGWIYNTMIPSWTLFVYLFLMISGFGMFCGYYDKIRNANIDLNTFYLKRYKKIFPFFFSLIVFDVVLEHSVSHLIEGVTEATLVFGLLPNNQLSVIGVAWTLGVIFLFYMLFPFFVFLCWDKRRVWISFFTSVVICFFCDFYFFTEKFVVTSFVPRHSFLYCVPYFIGGGVIYLYRKEISEFVSRYRWIWLGVCITVTIGYFASFAQINSLKHPGSWMLLIFFPWLMYAIGVKSKLLNNRIMKYLSGISMELYLAQMVIFRIVEKVNGLYIFGHGWISFGFVWLLVIIGLIAFIEIWKKAYYSIKKYLFYNIEKQTKR